MIYMDQSIPHPTSFSRTVEAPIEALSTAPAELVIHCRGVSMDISPQIVCVKVIFCLQTYKKTLQKTCRIGLKKIHMPISRICCALDKK